MVNQNTPEHRLSIEHALPADSVRSADARKQLLQLAEVLIEHGFINANNDINHSKVDASVDRVIAHRDKQKNSHSHERESTEEERNLSSKAKQENTTKPLNKAQLKEAMTTGLRILIGIRMDPNARAGETHETNAAQNEMHGRAHKKAHRAASILKALAVVAAPMIAAAGAVSKDNQSSGKSTKTPKHELTHTPKLGHSNSEMPSAEMDKSQRIADQFTQRMLEEMEEQRQKKPTKSIDAPERESPGASHSGTVSHKPITGPHDLGIHIEEASLGNLSPGHTPSAAQRQAEETKQQQQSSVLPHTTTKGKK